MLITTTLYGIIVGVLASSLWGPVFGVTLSTSIKIGALVGAIFGVLVALFGKAATVHGNVKQTEATFVNSSILTLIGLLTIGSGALAWVIRWIFF